MYRNWGKLIHRNLSAVMLSIALISCGGGGSGQLEHSASETAGIDWDAPLRGSPGVTYSDLRDALSAVFAELGIDPDKVTAAAPQGPGNAVFDLGLSVTDPDGAEGLLPPTGIELSWTERQLGDYDQNGEVGISDLTPLGLYFSSAIDYDDPADHNGIEHWPTGDPAGLGAFNWRLARVDGDGNGELNIADITPIGMNWKATISGYRVYRKLDGGEYELLPSMEDPELPYTLTRPAIESDAPVRYAFSDVPPADGAYMYYVAPYHQAADDEGSPSNLVEAAFNTVIPENELPVAVLTADPAAGTVPLLVSFDGSASSDADGGLVRFEWDYDGDGIFDFDSVDVSTTEHSYSSLGEFAPTLRVTDNRGGIATATAEVSVALPPNSAPTAGFSVSPAEGGTLDQEVPLEVIIDPALSTDPDGHPLMFEWDYDGDGTVDELRSGTAPFNYVYSEPGEMVPQVLVRDQIPVDSKSDTAVYDSVIHALPNQPPVAILTATPTEGELPLFVEFDASQSFDPSPGGQIIYYEWDFDGDRKWDSEGWNLSTAEFTYTESRPLVAPAVRVTDGGGATGADSVLITLPYIEGWVFSEVFQASSAGLYPSVAMVEGHPAVCFQWFHIGVGYCRAEDPLGITWGQLIDVDTIYQRDPLRFGKGYHNTLIEVGGHPAIVSMEDSSGLSSGIDDPIRISYVRANDPLGSTWPVPQIIVNGLANFSSGVSGAVINGRPAFSWRRTEVPASIQYVRAADTLGSNWQQPVTAANQTSIDTTLGIVQGIPWILHCEQQEGPNIASLSRALDADGVSWAGRVDAPVERCVKLATVGGNPAVVSQLHPDYEDYFGVQYARALDETGTEWSEKVILVDPYEGRANYGAGFAVVDGKPAVSYVLRAPEQLIYHKAVDELGAEWEEPEIVLENVVGYDGGWVNLLSVGDEQPLIIFRRREPNDPTLRGLFAATYFPPAE